MATNIFRTAGLALPDQIGDAPLAAAHIAQHVQFHVSILAIVGTVKADTIGITDLRTYYQGLYDKEDLAFKQSQAYELTKQIRQLDTDRDNIYRFLRDTIKANLRALELDKRQAAEHLSHVMGPYLKSERAPFDEETALLRNLVQDFSTTSSASAVAKLGLTATVAKLNEANNNFDETYTYRIDDKAAREAIDNMKTVRPQVDEAYRGIVQVINALHTANELSASPDVTKRALLAPMITAINGQIIQLRENIIAVSRKPSEKIGT